MSVAPQGADGVLSEARHLQGTSSDRQVQATMIETAAAAAAAAAAAPTTTTLSPDQAFRQKHSTSSFMPVPGTSR
jgi:hypothetical protein